MKGRYVSTGIVLGSLVALAVVGCATGSKMPVGTGDIVADRQRLMKLNGASWADAQAKAKAGQFEAIAVNAETMAVNAMHIPSVFPQGSLTDKSKAKPDVWQKWDEFEKAANNMVAWSGRLRDAARAKDNQQVETIMKDFGAQACGTCHRPFRVPPPQQPAPPRS